MCIVERPNIKLNSTHTTVYSSKYSYMCCKVDTFLLPRKLVAYCLQMKCTDIIFEGEAKEREREREEGKGKENNYKKQTKCTKRNAKQQRKYENLEKITLCQHTCYTPHFWKHVLSVECHLYNLLLS